MQVTRQSLSEYYEALSDDELRTMFYSGELTALAQQVAQTELERRGISVVKGDLDAEKEAVGKRPQPETEATEADQDPDMKADFVSLVELRGLIEAEMLRGRLCSEGVTAIIVDAPMVRPLAGVSRILVPHSQLVQAQDVVRAVQSTPHDLGDLNERRRIYRHGDFIIVILLLIIGIFLLWAMFSTPNRNTHPHGSFNWGFRSNWSCTNPGLDPICFQHPSPSRGRN